MLQRVSCKQQEPVASSDFLAARCCQGSRQAFVSVHLVCLCQPTAPGPFDDGTVEIFDKDAKWTKTRRLCRCQASLSMLQAKASARTILRTHCKNLMSAPMFGSIKLHGDKDA